MGMMQTKLVVAMGSIIEDKALQNRVSVFGDRTEAGRRVASLIVRERIDDNPVVCAIPAGGVPIGIEVARALGCPLRMAVVRKVQIPWNPEAGFGAVTWDGRVFLNQDLLAGLRLTDEAVDAAVEKARRSVKERLAMFVGDRKEPPLSDTTVILTDDGLASGYTMFAAVRAARSEGPREVVVAVPTGSADAVTFLAREADLVICTNVRTGYAFAVAEAYERWYDLSDRDVKDILKQAQDMGLF